jgi:DNA-binding NarL/FixJ family response regulator
MVKTKILIADDHPIFLSGLVNALKDHPKYEVAGTAADGIQVLPEARACHADVVILDINMPGKTGLEVLEELKTALPQTRVVLMTMYLPAEIHLRPEKLTADAYVLKNSGTEVLLDALESATAGRRYLDPSIQKKGEQNTNDLFARQARLSGREKEILKLILEGLTNQQIAERLFVSDLTVKTHRKHIMSKMDAHNLADLLQKAKS